MSFIKKKKKKNTSRLTGKRGIKRSPNRAKKAPKTGPSFLPVFCKRCAVTGCCLGFLVLLGFSLLYGYRLLTSLDSLAINEIHIQGNMRLTDTEVLNIGDVQLGRNNFDINVAVVERNLSAAPWIERVTVRRELPDKLYISVAEMEPSFWVLTDNVMYYADIHGKPIAPVTTRRFASLPLLDIKTEQQHESTLLPQIVDKIDKLDLPFSLGQTAWIRLTDAGDMEIYLDSRRLLLRFGLQDWQKQLQRVEYVWQDLARRGELEQISAISASRGQVWVTKRT
ncbi:MAG: cell division protein FtsQ/DivIB [Desulfovibrio sp.]